MRMDGLCVGRNAANDEQTTHTQTLAHTATTEQKININDSH